MGRAASTPILTQQLLLSVAEQIITDRSTGGSGSVDWFS
jgi:hypothetical protein